MSGGHEVGSISKLHQDAQFINDESVEWNRLVGVVYAAINALTTTWEGEARSTYVTKVNDAQPDLIELANLLNGLSATLGTVSNMYRVTEEGGDPRQAERMEPQKFTITDMIKGSGGNDSNFDPNECNERSSEIRESASKLSSILLEVKNSIDSINSNYSSEFGNLTKNYLEKASEECEEHIKAIDAFGKYLVEEVAPKYSYIDSATEEMSESTISQ